MSGVIVLLLSAVFLIAALSKLQSQPEFGAVLRQLLPASLVRAAALFIPAAELILAVFLLSGIASRTAVLASMAVLVVFTIFLVVMWRRGLKGCGCFGEDEETATPGNGIIRNFMLIALPGLVVAGPETIVLYGPDFSTVLGRVTVVAGAICLWPCLVTLVNRRKYIFNVTKV